MPMEYSNRGLPNFGSTCYVNSAIQLLFSTRHFMPALETAYMSNVATANLIEQTGFTLVTSSFLLCARYTNIVHAYPISENITTKEDALSYFIDNVSKRNRLFQKCSGQQSSAEYICFLLHLLRTEAILVKEYAINQKDSFELTLHDIEQRYNEFLSI